MKKIFGFLMLLVLIIIVTGCNGEPIAGDYSSMIGHVMNKENKSILVVDPVAQDFSSTGGVKEFYNAISFSNAPEEIKIGDKVEVWFDAVAESYPGQSEVKDIKVIEEEKPEGADLTPSKALRNVIALDEKNQFTVLYSIDYDKDRDKWTIQLKELLTENTQILEYEIED